MRKRNITIVLIILLCLLLISVMTHRVDKIDQVVYDIISKVQLPFIDVLLICVTTLLHPVIICLLCVIATILYKKRNRILIPINLISATLLAHGLKYVFKRPRPEINLIGETGFSLPSAHACVSLAFIGFILYLMYQENKKMRWSIVILGTLLILLIGISRIYLGVHYFSDIIIGYLVAIIYLIFYTKILEKHHLL